MKLFMAALATETNTFSPIPTGWAGFKEGRTWHRDDGSRHPPAIGNIPLITWRRRAEADGNAMTESICTFAQPAGTTLRHVYEGLRDMLLDDLRQAGPMDVVLLFMHGAMVAHGYDDCEGDTLARVREVVGPATRIGIELDLHCHLTELMRTSADVIITYKEYPHIDMAERADELYTLCVRAAAGEIAPVMAYHDCRMISMWRTPQPPMRGFVERMQALEGEDGILSVSFGHGFPWGDVEEVGAKMLVIADGDAEKAQALAARLGAEIWAMREATSTRHDSIDEGIDHAMSGGGAGPMVLADVADNAGGGAPSDNTAILRRLVDRGITGAVIGCFWDPQAVLFCVEAGEGASFLLRIGGKCGPASGDPVDLLVTVRKIENAYSQTGLSGGRAGFGPSVWVSAGGIDIVLVSMRQQTFAPDAFTGLGITLHDKAVVVVKSTQHFHAAFAPVAREIRYVSAPGAIPPEYADIPFTKRTRPFWPRVADPFAATNL
jgi:microcystin degradation protein MlrC